MRIHEMIVNLQKIRKEIDKLSIDLADEPWISSYAADTSYNLTIAIKQLVVISRTIKKVKENKDEEK